MTKTKLLLTGLLAGAVALGTACKTEKSHANTSTDQTPPMATDAGTGGTGYENPDRGPQGVTPVPEDSTREMGPGVHQGPHEQPGTGGTGLGQEPVDQNDNLGHDNLGHETSDEPRSPGAPSTGPGTENSDEPTDRPQH
ncbi:MAG: hypothetical protein ACXU86_25175 [Archangium sp.]